MNTTLFENQSKLFVTGTDTDIGKTYVTCHLLKTLASQGKTTLGLKPIASGCEQTAKGLRNSDALQLQAASSLRVDYDCINPITIEPPIAPHLGNVPLSVAGITESLTPGLMQETDITFIEGVGGLLVPLNERETQLDLITALNVPVLIVVGMRLGCLNHALMTNACLKHAGVEILGWIANTIDPNMAYLEENIATLKSSIDAPLIDIIPFEFEIKDHLVV